MVNGEGALSTQQKTTHHPRHPGSINCIVDEREERPPLRVSHYSWTPPAASAPPRQANHIPRVAITTRFCRGKLENSHLGNTAGALRNMDFPGFASGMRNVSSLFCHDRTAEYRGRYRDTGSILATSIYRSDLTSTVT